MPPFRSAALTFRPTLAFVLLTLLLTALWISGGASAIVPGQVLIQGTAWTLLVVGIFLGNWRWSRPGAALIVPCLGGLLCVAQLVPLPPSWWQGLPSRHMLNGVPVIGEPTQPWRPWSTGPGLTASTLGSLVVPIVTWIFVAGLSDKERRWLPGLLLGLVAASTLLGLLQFSGVLLDNPLINGTSGQVAGTFANRNHFALLLAIGCLLAPAVGLANASGSKWRAPLAGGVVLLLLLTLLASGSRAGLILGPVASAIGIALAYPGLRRLLAARPAWVLPAVIGGVVTVAAALVALSFLADRAVSIDRMFVVEHGRDMRSRGLPTVLAMIGANLPMGSGLGTFDAVFRMNEPLALLKPTYFNHAHNDYLEIVLTAGLPGLVLLLGALTWWARASIVAWRAPPGQSTEPRLGSAVLFLVLLASIFDYPARTPLIMAIMVIAAAWLDDATGEPASLALPRADKYL